MRVGIVGLGTMGTTHAGGYQNIADCELVAVADIQPERCRAMVERYGVRSYATLADMLVAEALDVIDVCLPTHLHLEHVEMAAAAGKHVFFEKPLARNRTEGEAMVKACRKAGVTLGVGHVVRFFPEYRRAKEIIASGQLGNVGTVYTYRGGGGFPTAWQDWYANYEWSGGLTLDMIIHDFDFLRWTLGEVDRVYAKSTFGRDYNRLEHVLVSLRFRNGVIGNIEGTWLNVGGFGTKFEFACEKGLLTHDSKIASAFRSYPQITSPQVGGPGVAVPESPLDKDPYTVELEHFIQCLHQGQKPLTSGEEALYAIDIAVAALESIKTGKPVKVYGGVKQ
ncbi:MAG: Gfo/Idh/MocA family oxidoreductase [Firmicutes bacterium]|nr:Gfo/Idh/MocA family oxidoreductase [Bacillota bacterium]